MSVSLMIVDYIQENHLSGTEIFSIKSIAKTEVALGLSCLEPVFA